MLDYVYIAPKLAALGMHWDSAKSFYWPMFTDPNCFSRLKLWG